MFIFVFIIPFSMILYANIRSFIIVIVHFIQILFNFVNISWKIFKLNKRSRQAVNLREKILITAQKKIALITSYYVLGFVCTWTPYSFVSIYTAFINSKETLPVTSTVSAILAKSSVVWSSLLYLLTNSSIRSKLTLDLFRAKKSKLFQLV